MVRDYLNLPRLEEVDHWAHNGPVIVTQNQSMKAFLQNLYCLGFSVDLGLMVHCVFLVMYNLLVLNRLCKLLAFHCDKVFSPGGENFTCWYTRGRETAAVRGTKHDKPSGDKVIYYLPVRGCPLRTFGISSGKPPSKTRKKKEKEKENAVMDFPCSRDL